MTVWWKHSRWAHRIQADLCLFILMQPPSNKIKKKQIEKKRKAGAAEELLNCHVVHHRAFNVSPQPRRAQMTQLYKVAESAASDGASGLRP